VLAGQDVDQGGRTGIKIRNTIISRHHHGVGAVGGILKGWDLRRGAIPSAVIDTSCGAGKGGSGGASNIVA